MNKLKELRLKSNMTQKALAMRLSVSQSAISAWERGIFQMNSSKMKEIANFFGVTVDYLLGDVSESAREMKRFIVLPTKNISEIESEGILPPSVIQHGEYLCFTVIGDSMEPDMRDGDIAIVQFDEKYETGDIILLALDKGYRALQHVTKVENGVILKSLNPNYNLIPYSERQLTYGNICIAGRLIEVRRRYR